MKTRALVWLAAIAVSGCATQTGPWEGYEKTSEDAEWVGGYYSGKHPDPEAELIDHCRSGWRAGAPYALQLRHVETDERVTVTCSDVQD
ncbi:hypothetical protein SAMN04488052_102218 [Aquisalimonas asiatica]|uniref:Lipoprotein n=1 Tax=Aquisalimonas asiatica TaxID=406100 RepID=A0A1H8RSE9_9GAMM|nr:hypothetical protein SAMN04488052_102218 [Aquisalimonas asiatica]